MKSKFAKCIQVWFLAARPKTLSASIAPVSIGAALAFYKGFFHAPSFFATLCGALLIQIGTNYANDYWDFQKGTDRDNRLGPARAVASGWIQAQTMKQAAMGAFGCAALISIYLIYRAGWPIFVIGVLAIASGLAYTAGPKPLSYLGLGDFFVLIFFGPIAVGGTFFVQTLTCPAWVIFAGMIPGFLSVAILAVNNLRDVNTDKLSDKRTLAVRFGKIFTQWEYTLSFLIALGLVLGTTFPLHPKMSLILFFICLVFSLPNIKKIWFYRQEKELNRLLAQTGVFLLCVSLSYSAFFIWITIHDHYS